MDILLTGGSGQVGQAILRSAPPTGWRFYAPSRDQLDLEDVASVNQVLCSRPWEAVINCGAYTAVDRAESEAGRCWAINATAPSVLARWCAEKAIPLIHLSSDYVYGGDKSSPYVEADRLAPLSVYGASKAAGDLAVTTAGGRFVILRTSWVVSATGANFVKTMLRLAQERSELRVVNDQFGAPTSADDLAAATLRVLQLSTDAASAPSGVYHAVNRGETSWFGVAEAVFAIARRRGLKSPRLMPISSAEYPTPARRPSNSRLDGAKLARDYGVTFPDWRLAVQPIVETLLEDGTRI